jgi:MFS-type transporter involved in bile tolerance (Atg22 family)
MHASKAIVTIVPIAAVELSKKLSAMILVFISKLEKILKRMDYWIAGLLDCWIVGSRYEQSSSR